MPKRILDDSLLDSRSLEVLTPRAQDAFPRFILLADDFGCFEVNPRILWAKGWSRRPDVSEQDVADWITEYAERQAQNPETGERLPPVLMLWTHAGRRYAYLTGWHGPHGQKKRAEYDPNAPTGTPGRHGSKRKSPAPPADLLAEVMAGNVRAVDGKPPGTDREPTGNPEDENPNNSTPARETTGSEPGNGREVAGKHAVPGPAVPVAVPVADAVAPLALVASEAPKTEKAADQRFAPLRAAWEAEFKAATGSEYRWSGPADAKGIHRVIAVPVAEFRERARRGLRAVGFLRCGTVAKLTSGEVWNQLAAPTTGPPGKRPGMAAMGSAEAFERDEKPW